MHRALLVSLVVGCAAPNPPLLAIDGGRSEIPAADSGLASTTCRTTGCSPGMRCSAIETCIPEGTCAHSNDCSEGFACDATTRTCSPGSACGAQEFASTRVAPNLLIVLDRSCSMLFDLGDGSGRTRWDAAVGVLAGLATEHASDLQWGLELFPDTDYDVCNQALDVVTFGGGAAVRDTLVRSLDSNDPIYPDEPCVTNISTALDKAASQAVLGDPMRPSYVLLFSDGGEARCGNPLIADEHSTEVISQLAARGVPTFVVGFGVASDRERASLTTFANAGGRPSSATGYYQAEDEASLERAVGEIVRGVVSCDFALTAAPADASLLYVFMNDAQAVQHDPANGWEYDASRQQLQLRGAACDSLRSGTVSDVDIVYGCPEPVLE